MPESLPEGSDDPGGSVSIITFWGGGESHQPKPVRDLYAVFRRAPQTRDLRTQEIARADAYGDSLDDGSTGTAPLGTPVYSETRLVSGTLNHGVYALPTTTQAVCTGALPNGGGSCGEPGPHGLTVAFDDPGHGLPLRLYGLIGDEVRNVDLVAAGATHHAELGENAYGVELRGVRSTQLERLILYLGAGGTDALSLRP
jgi:hypothetical protein